MRKAAVVGACLLFISVLLFSQTGAFADANPAFLDELASASADGADPHNDRTEGARGIEFREVSSAVDFEYGSEPPNIDTPGNSGVFVADYDRDGWPDILVTGGEDPILFHNDGGTFTPSGLLPAFERRIRTAVWYDHDNDGWQDLLVFPSNGTSILLENRRGTFERHSVERTGNLSVPMGASIGDYDRDGCLDAFVIQNGDWGEEHPDGMFDLSVPVDGDNGEPNLLLFGTCSFDDPFVRANATSVRVEHWSLATSTVDLNGDGWPDVHVANDFNRDVVYLNRGNGTFERHYLGESTDRNAMSSEVADVNEDGRPDLFVTNIYYPDEVEVTDVMERRSKGNNLLINRGNGTMGDRARDYGVAKGGWGWAAVIADLDNDADQDLVHATQTISFESGVRHVDEGEQELIHRRFPFYRYPVVRERSGGGRFVSLSAEETGFEETDGRGLASLDFDRDGDVDLVVAPQVGSFKLYENIADEPRAIQVVVESADLPAVGATVTASTDGADWLRYRTARADFLSQDSRLLHFGLGNSTAADVEVVWSDGTTRVVEDVRAGQRVYVSAEGPVRRTSIQANASAD